MMLGYRSGLCLALLIVLAGSLDAGLRKQRCCKAKRACGCQAPVATCAAPPACAASDNCVSQSCGCAAGAVGYGAGFSPLLGGGGLPVSYPTAGLVPPVAPGEEIVW